MSYIILSGDMEMKDLNEIIEENKKANEIPKITKTKQSEPKWIEIIKTWKMLNKKVSDEYVYSGLEKMAKTCDVVRQAQKQKKIIVIQDGHIFEVKQVAKYSYTAIGK
jgi:hypothetical protein